MFSKMNLQCIFVMIFATTSAYGMNGLYQIGHGAKSKGMGGVAVAYPQDSLAGIANPAGIIDVRDRLDLAGEYIYHTQSDRETTTPEAFTILTGSQNFNKIRNAGLAESGYKTSFNDCMAGALLFTVQAGGFNKYKSRSGNLATFQDILYGQNLKVAYAAMTPCFAMRITENHTLGIGVDITGAAVNFKNFDAIAKPELITFPPIRSGSLYPHHVTNKGWNYGIGAAVRLGWYWKPNPCLAFGLSYRSQTYVTRFHNYKGLLAERGKGNLPAIYSAGVAIAFIPRTVLAFDICRIEFGKVRAFANATTKFEWNPVQNFALVTNPHGGKNGVGFGWKSRTAYKVGVSFEVCDRITLRAGYNYMKPPMSKLGPSSSIFIPVGIKHHLTVGGTWLMRPCMELSFAYIHGFRNVVRGHPNPIKNLPPELSIIQAGNLKSHLKCTIDNFIIELSCLF